MVAAIDRLEAVQLCLDRLTCLLDTAIEIIVVVGPGGDHVAEAVAARKDVAALLRNPERNLARSRNMALSLARGEFIAFIDDDAYPTEWWLDDLLGEFKDEEVVAVGGTVYDYTGYTYQMRYGRCTNAGDATPVNAPPLPGISECPSASTFTYATGGNFVTRTQTLRALDGFDEQFDYYLEETDLCRRMLDGGGIVRVLDAGQIFHKFLPSAIRSHSRIALNRRSILVNRAYFAARHQRGLDDAATVMADFDCFAAKAIAELDHAYHAGLATLEHLEAVKRDANDARAHLLNWMDNPPVRTVSHIEPGAHARLNEGAVSLRSSKGVSHIALLFEDELLAHHEGENKAQVLKDEGHIVRILEPSTHHATVDIENGVWRHRVSMSPRTCTMANALFFELDRIAAEQRRFDTVVIPPSMSVESREALGLIADSVEVWK